MVEPANAQTVTDLNTKPSKITITSPINNSFFNTSTILLSINVGLPEFSSATDTYLLAVYYKTDYQQNQTSIYDSSNTTVENRIDSSLPNPNNRLFSYSNNLTAIPSGNHNITVYALSGASYFNENAPDYFDTYQLQSNATIYFTVEIQNQQNASPTVPEFQVLTIPTLLILIVAPGLLVYFKKHKAGKTE